MFENLLNHHWLVAIPLFVFMVLAVEFGYRTGIKSRIEDDQDRKEQIKSIGDGLFVLLSLLVSFTLTMAVSRYDHRRADRKGGRCDRNDLPARRNAGPALPGKCGATTAQLRRCANRPLRAGV